ncbi:MAG TPA: hypothetical protein VFU47_16975, partial [Armatimonadota bacterium]|nr:hypothetical protein [Armatimonadota bacterium]
IAPCALLPLRGRWLRRFTAGMLVALAAHTALRLGPHGPLLVLCLWVGVTGPALLFRQVRAALPRLRPARGGQRGARSFITPW